MPTAKRRDARLTGSPLADAELNEIIRLAMRTHVQGWYSGVAEDGGPAGEIESLLRQLAVRVVAQLKQVRALRGVVEAWGVALITGRLRSTS